MIKCVYGASGERLQLDCHPSLSLSLPWSERRSRRAEKLFNGQANGQQTTCVTQTVERSNKPKYTKTEDITVTKTDPSLLIFWGGNFQMK